MKLIDKVRSKTGEVTKFVFEIRGNNVEFSFINRGDGKHHVCCPSQTGCRMGCKFCFLTDYDIPAVNLTSGEIVYCVAVILSNVVSSTSSPTLLISFMGSGEPLLNQTNLSEAMLAIKQRWQVFYPCVRFAVATLVPNLTGLRTFTRIVFEDKLNVKIHWSLHTAKEWLRSGMMPSASTTTAVVPLLKTYREMTGNAVEAHYTLIHGVNDAESDAFDLAELLRGTNIPVKFIEFNEKPGSPLRKSTPEALQAMQVRLAAYGILTEAYCPPGADISSACGQFAAKYYRKAIPDEQHM